MKGIRTDRYTHGGNSVFQGSFRHGGLHPVGILVVVCLGIEALHFLAVQLISLRSILLYQSGLIALLMRRGIFYGMCLQGGVPGRNFGRHGVPSRCGFVELHQQRRRVRMSGQR